MIQKIKNLCFLIYFLLISALFSQDDKVKVIVAEAVIYAQASEHSTQIDTVKKGTILTLFKPGQSEGTWYYVHYRSESWNAKVSGFVYASKVEHLTAVPKEEPAPVESKVPPVTEIFQIEKTSSETPLPSSRIIVLPAPTGAELQSEIFKPAITESPAALLFPEKQKQLFPIDKPEIAKAKLTAPKLVTQIEISIGEVTSPPGRVLILPKIPGMESYSPIISKPPKKPAAPAAKPQKIIQIPAIETPKISKVKISPRKQEVQVDKRLGEIPVPPVRILVFPQEKEPESRSRVFLAAPKITPTPSLAPPVEEEKPTPQIQRPLQLLKPKSPESKFQLLTISLGYGSTTGGIGGSIQMNTRSGLSFHAGIGYYPAKYIFSDYGWITNKVFFSGGIKYYLPFKSQRLRPYLDLQFGGIKVEAVQLVLGVWNYEYIIENHQKALWGPSLLGGAEFKLGFLGINAALGLAYNTTSWELWDENFIITGDVSLLLYF